MKNMKSIRCEFKGHFYIDVNTMATPDEIEDALSKYISAIEDSVGDYLTLNEYEWEEVEIV